MPMMVVNAIFLVWEMLILRRRRINLKEKSISNIVLWGVGVGSVMIGFGILGVAQSAPFASNWDIWVSLVKLNILHWVT